MASHTSTLCDRGAVSTRPATRIRALLVTALLVMCVAVVDIYAQEVPVATWYCGISLTVPGIYNMTNDISCPNGGTGISILSSDITLNLQGHSIAGPSNRRYLTQGVNVIAERVTIEGPGTIRDFTYGIVLNRYSTISHVHIEDFNLYGIVAGDNNTIAYNTLHPYSAGANYGIRINFPTNSYVASNVVMGSAYGVWLLGVGTNAQVKQNALIGNQYGLAVDYLSDIQMTVAENDLSNNSYCGAVINGYGEITNNYFNANAYSGLCLRAGAGFSVNNNRAFRNGSYGISVENSSGNNIQSNTAIGNGDLDLRWNGNGGGNTWANNHCDTWSVNLGDRPCVFP